MAGADAWDRPIRRHCRELGLGLWPNAWTNGICVQCCRPARPLKIRGLPPGLEGFPYLLIITRSVICLPPKAIMDIDRGRHRLELDESIAINNGGSGGDRGNDSLLQRPLFIIVALVLSPSVGFCWRLMLVSFLSAYHYALFVERSYKPPRDCGVFSFSMAQFAFNTAIKLSVLAGLSVWCLSLTPVHIF